MSVIIDYYGPVALLLLCGALGWLVKSARTSYRRTISDIAELRSDVRQVRATQDQISGQVASLINAGLGK